MLLLALGGSACFQRSVDLSPAKVRDDVRPVTYEVIMDGALQATVRRGGVRVRELSLNDARFSGAQLFSLASDWVRGKREEVAVLFSFLNYKGDGVYEIEPGGESNEVGVQDAAEVQVQYRPLRDPDDTRAFYVRLVACRVRIERLAAAGSMVCERLADGSGGVISLRVRWW